MPINCSPHRSLSCGDLSRTSETTNLHRSSSKRCGNLNEINSTDDPRLNLFRDVKNTIENLKNPESRQSSEAKKEKLESKPYQKRTLKTIGFDFYQFTSKRNYQTEPTPTPKKAEVSPVTLASSEQELNSIKQKVHTETVSAQKKNKLSRLWQGIKEVFSFLFRSCFPRTKTKSNDATTISKTEIAGGKTVSKDTLNELLKKIDELIKTEGLDGLFRESGSSSHLNELTQQVNSGEKVDIDKIDNRDTAIGFFKRIMKRVTPLKYEEVQTILSNKITHKEIGEELSKIINSKYPEEFLMILKTLGKFFEKASNNENSKFNVTSFTTCIPNLIKCESGNPNLLLEQSKEIPKMIEKILHKDTLEAIFTNITITSL
ncbi:MAG: hypothetical protein HamCj_11000 [Candidatus Hamiltonella defensa (Ceratovacuna japonica)]